MSAPRVEIPGVPMVGPTGERDNITRLLAHTQALLPPGSVLLASISHDDGCRCANGRRSIEHCTCDTVDVTLETVRPEAN